MHTNVLYSSSGMQFEVRHIMNNVYQQNECSIPKKGELSINCNKNSQRTFEIFVVE